MHIAFLTPEYPHKRVSHAAGIGTSIKNLVDVLVTTEVQVSIFVYGQKEDAVFEEDNVKIHLIKNQNYKFLGWFLHRKHIQNYLNKYIVSDAVDLIEAPDWTGITAFMKLKAPLIIRFHGSDTYFCHLEKRRQKLKNFWFEKLAIGKATAFIAPTHFAGELSKQLFHIRNKTVKTIHSGLKLSDFHNTNPLVYQKGLVLYIGTIIRKKGVLELPSIFKKVRCEFPDAQMVLIGSDSYDVQTNSKSTWEILKQELDSGDLDAVSYLGKIPYQQVQEYIKKAHVCVFPTFAETFGMVTIESMAMQKPVVNSNIGWAQELIVDEESGFLVHPSNHNLYADRIVELLKNKDLANDMGNKARLRVEDNFDTGQLVKLNIEFYSKIINTILR
ncbi:glycosyltransferase family 4 protein [Flavobacterium gyeonganense]|uniref:Glycosyltransferase family 4 protein n=2 Tax=Flavobacterium gyeonganense TaxID=1310418 RepID=A0ABV5H834_9FLAO|nr:glycosyltransferase family 4 protein [Flavobacterium gyeonganense]